MPLTIKVVSHEAIAVKPNRFRKKFDEKKLEELKASIRENGILFPPIIKWEDGTPFIVAGERRLRAMRALIAEGQRIRTMDEVLASGEIPFIELNDLSVQQQKEIELTENTERDDLTWQERAQATAELFKLRKEANPELTTQAFTESIGVAAGSQTQVKNRIHLGNAILNDKEIASAPTEKEATKRLFKKLESQATGILADLVMSEDGEDFLDGDPGYTATHGFELLTGDVVEKLALLQDNAFDVILTDPPYGMGADLFGTGAVHKYDDGEDETKAMLSKVLPELFRVAKEKAHMYLFCDIDMFHWLRDAATEAGWYAWRTPLVWAKGSGHIPMVHLGPMRSYEFILYCIKGDRPVVQTNVPDTIIVPSVPRLERTHAAEKPVDLYLNLLRRSVIFGDSILDAFCGSGVIFEAAHKLKLEATGIDLDTSLAAARIDKVLNAKQTELDLL